jgi:hypothetical protein
MLPNKRMEPAGAIVFKEAGRLCPGWLLFTFNYRVRGARVARGSCAVVRRRRRLGLAGRAPIDWVDDQQVETGLRGSVQAPP